MFQIDKKKISRFIIGLIVVNLACCITLFTKTTWLITTIFTIFNVGYISVYVIMVLDIINANKKAQEIVKGQEGAGLVKFTWKELRTLRKEGVVEKDGKFFVDKEVEECLKKKLT